MTAPTTERPLAPALRAVDRWFRASGIVTMGLLAATGVMLLLGHEVWRPAFALAHLTALLALVPLGAVLVLRAYVEAQQDTVLPLAAAREVTRRYPVVTSLVVLAFVTAGISLANFQDGERWLRTGANLATVAIVVALVARYVRSARLG